LCNATSSHRRIKVIRLAFRVAVEIVIYARPYRPRKGSVDERLACWTQAQ